MDINEIIKKKLKSIIILGVIMGVAFGTMIWSHSSPKYIVEISTNPHIEIKGNIYRRIIEFNGLDSAGKEIIKDLSLKGTDVRDGVLILVDEFKTKNYLKEENNLIINIWGDSTSKAEELKISLESSLNDYFEYNNIKTAYVVLIKE